MYTPCSPRGPLRPPKNSASRDRPRIIRAAATATLQVREARVSGTPSAMILLACLLAWLFLYHSHARAENFPIAPDIAVKPDPQFLAEQQLDERSQESPDMTGSEPSNSPDSPQASRDQCANASQSLYHKAIAITAFPRSEAGSSQAGSLHQVEHLLPELLGQQLQERAQILTSIQLNQGLPAVSQSTDQRLAAQVQGLARSHRTQFVLSGEVLDMSMTNSQTTYDPSLYTRLVSGVHDSLNVRTRFDKRDRHFSFQVSLRDGFTGQLLFARRYDTHGIWGIRHPLNVGFGSPLFWKSDYGREIKTLVNAASKDLAAAIDCQPYIARIDARPGQQQIVLHSGANNGLRSGDRLELYQLVAQPVTGEYQLYDTRLVNRNTTIELREVYPSYSVALVNSDALLNGQYLAVAP